jgi:menaquinone-dependent protoporphyrinogen oxidase
MKILVAYASKHGSTGEIARAVAEKLRAAGNEVDLGTVAEVADVGTYEAYVIGSAVYYGSWMKEATAFALSNSAWLARRPVWLFSSGPVGSASRADPKELVTLGESIAPLDHRVFYGALDRHHLSIGERIVVGAVGTPDGDYRDWREIDAWADEIVREVKKLEAVPA